MQRDAEEVRESREGELSFQRELEKRVFHLKTLYEVGQVISSLRDPREIAKNLLLMMMGACGAIRGVVLLTNEHTEAPELLACRGLEKTFMSLLSQPWEGERWPDRNGVGDVILLQENAALHSGENGSFWGILAAYHIYVWIPFAINDQVKGGIGLGGKLSGESYTPDDQELFGTLTQQLIVSLDNALAYRAIAELNRGLEEKVRQRTEDLRLEHERLKDAHHQLELRNQFIRTAFGRYVSDEVVVKLLEKPEGLNLGGEKRHVTILMSDLRGFTALAERLSPEQMLTIVNRYLGTMVDVILRYQGTINEFLGDAVLVIFGAPVSQGSDARRAVACAVAMQQAMALVNAENRREGLPEVEMGIGVHSGEVVVGNIGSYRRTKYGVVGSAVNLTSRIESYTVGGQILISDVTRQEVGPILLIEKQVEVEAKGFDKPLMLYDVRGVTGKYQLFLQNQEEEFFLLPQEIPLRYSLIEGKYLDRTAVTGRFVKLSASGGVIQAEESLPFLSNIRIQLVDLNGHEISGAVYGKVVKHLGEGGFVVRFTSPPSELLKILSQKR